MQKQELKSEVQTMSSVRECVAERWLAFRRSARTRSMSALPARSRHRPSVADIFQHSRTCIWGPAWVHCSRPTDHSAPGRTGFVVCANFLTGPTADSSAADSDLPSVNRIPSARPGLVAAHLRFIARCLKHTGPEHASIRKSRSGSEQRSPLTCTPPWPVSSSTPELYHLASVAYWRWPLLAQSSTLSCEWLAVLEFKGLTDLMATCLLRSEEEQREQKAAEQCSQSLRSQRGDESTRLAGKLCLPVPKLRLTTGSSRFWQPPVEASCNGPHPQQGRPSIRFGARWLFCGPL